MSRALPRLGCPWGLRPRDQGHPRRHFPACLKLGLAGTDGDRKKKQGKQQHCQACGAPGWESAERRRMEPLQPSSERNVCEQERHNDRQLGGDPRREPACEHKDDAEYHCSGGGWACNVPPKGHRKSANPPRSVFLRGRCRGQSGEHAARGDHCTEPDRHCAKVKRLENQVGHASSATQRVVVVIAMATTDSAHAHVVELGRDAFSLGLQGILWISALAYVCMWTVARQRGRSIERPGWFRLCAYLSGVVLLDWTLFGWLDAYAEVSFAAHLSQHMLLISVVAPLLLAGRPGVQLANALSARVPWLVRFCGGLLRRLRMPPLLATSVCSFVMWTWHAPAALQHALLNDAVHWSMHLSFLAVGIWFWVHPLDAIARAHRSPWPPLGALLALMMQMGLIGALLVWAPEPLLGLQAQRAEAAGFDPLSDQQWAGVLMWVPFCLPFLLAAVLLARRSAESVAVRNRGRSHGQDRADVDS